MNTRINTWVLLALVAALLVSAPGCTQRLRGSATRTGGNPKPASEPVAESVHPPYDAHGRGALDGTLIGVTTETIHAGLRQQPIPYSMAVVRWKAGGKDQTSEFIVAYVGKLTVDGRSIIATSSELSVDLAPATLRKYGIGRPIHVVYKGMSQVPFEVEMTDYPYAAAKEIAIGH